MLSINQLKGSIDFQIGFNQGKNLFYNNVHHSIKIRQSTFDAVRSLGDHNNEKLSLLIEYTTEKVVCEFYRINQYFTFPEAGIRSLQGIYGDLYHDIFHKKQSFDSLSKRHYQNLRTWLKETNPFSQEVYAQKGALLESVVCAEYSPQLQADILHLADIKLHEPILDIGCGQNAGLVKFLRENNLDAYGIDRFPAHLSYTQKADWLTYEYGAEKWGLVISNLGFSNHFIHHHLREDGNFEEYARKYMEILRSLKIHGSFCYAPDLPFIEKYLDPQSYELSKYGIPGLSFQATIIKRIR